MRRRLLPQRLLALLAIALACAAPGSARAQAGGSTTAPKLQLTPAQKTAIYAAVGKDDSKVAPKKFRAAVGAEVPPMIELYVLPDDILAANPATKFYQYTVVEDRVVLVDPTRMRVIAVIGPGRLE